MALAYSYSSFSLLLLLLATVFKEITSQQSEVNSVDGPPWNYNPNSPHGPDNWKVSYPHCGGQHQSPINIPFKGATFESLLTDFSYNNYDNSILTEFELSNTGSSIKISVTPDSETTISGGGLAGAYKLAQLHFHWGKDNQQGSEHLIDGKASPLEVHLVHWSEKYPTFDEALNYTDGVAVLGVFIQVNSSSESFTSALGNLTAYFDEIPYPGNATTVPSFPLKSLLPNFRNYYRYQGSLTTPACEESVTWTVFHDPIYLNEKEVAAFRTIYDSAGEELLYNFRPTQPLNDRVVYTSLPASVNYVQPTASATVLATLSVVMASVSLTWTA